MCTKSHETIDLFIQALSIPVNIFMLKFVKLVLLYHMWKYIAKLLCYI